MPLPRNRIISARYVLVRAWRPLDVNLQLLDQDFADHADVAIRYSHAHEVFPRGKLRRRGIEYQPATLDRRGVLECVVQAQLDLLLDADGQWDILQGTVRVAYGCHEDVRQARDIWAVIRPTFLGLSAKRVADSGYKCVPGSR